MKQRLIVALALSFLLAACATPPPPPTVDTARTTVILLPDEEGNVGAIIVSTPEGSKKISEAYAPTVIDHANTVPSTGVAMTQDAVTGAYKALLAAQPTKPRTFILYFGLGTAELTAESRAILPEVLRVAAQRKPTEISIFGFADATGTEIRNEHLSAQRAQAIEAAMKKYDANLGHINVQYFGSKNPVVATPANVPEQKNRRAEIVIL